MPGEKGKYCSKHREEGMVDVLYTVSLQKNRVTLNVACNVSLNFVSQNMKTSMNRAINAGKQYRIDSWTFPRDRIHVSDYKKCAYTYELC